MTEAGRRRRKGQIRLKPDPTTVSVRLKPDPATPSVRLKPDTTKSETAKSETTFSPAERRLIARLRTPLDVQGYLNRLPYNTEPAPKGATLRSFRGVLKAGCAHCLEAALFAATVLEQHGYPPLVLSFESIDELDHVIFIYQKRGRWGSVARSRDPGLHGRLPVFPTPRALAHSYMDAYVDYTGRVKAYAVVHLNKAMGDYDWRTADTNVWKVERVLLDYPHRPIAMSDERYQRLLTRYREYRRVHGKKPLYYRGRENWTAIPTEFEPAAP